MEEEGTELGERRRQIRQFLKKKEGSFGRAANLSIPEWDSLATETDR